jgi:hypothetical protein
MQVKSAGVFDYNLDDVFIGEKKCELPSVNS